MEILILIGILFYFLPSLIGFNKSKSTGIFLLNLLLGWTFVGWVVALVWAVSADKDSVYDYICPKCGFKHGLNQRVKLHVCPQCKTETLYA